MSHSEHTVPTQTTWAFVHDALQHRWRRCRFPAADDGTNSDSAGIKENSHGLSIGAGEEWRCDRRCTLAGSPSSAEDLWIQSKVRGGGQECPPHTTRGAAHSITVFAIEWVTRLPIASAFRSRLVLLGYCFRTIRRRPLDSKQNQRRRTGVSAPHSRWGSRVLSHSTGRAGSSCLRYARRRNDKRKGEG